MEHLVTPSGSGPAQQEGLELVMVFCLLYTVFLTAGLCRVTASPSPVLTEDTGFSRAGKESSEKDIKP